MQILLTSLCFTNSIECKTYKLQQRPIIAFTSGTVDFWYNKQQMH